LRLLLDEMYTPAIATELRAQGHDVVSVHEAIPPLAGSADEEVLKFAVSRERALVTENVRDYRPLEAALLIAGGHSHGIVYTSNRQFPRGDPATTGRLVRALEALLRDEPTLYDRSIFIKRPGDC
jgi:hypothetical protein